MSALLRDLRHGVRQLFRRPAFAAAAIGSLALGIGLNTMNKDFPQLTTSYPDYLDIRNGADALSGVAANAYVRGILSTRERGVLVTGEAVTSNYFDLLGVRPFLGRAFRDDENVAPGAAPVVVLSHGLWRRRFGALPSVIGEHVKLSGHTYTVVGVGPPGFTGTLPGIPTEFWVPVMMVERLEFSGVQTSADNDPGTTRLERRGTRWLFLNGRLADGRTVADARAQIETIFSRLSTAYPLTNENVTASVVPATSIRFHPMLDGYIRAASAALLVAVGLVLLIACANVANMLLARGAARRRELAIRAAIGASRARLVRQLLTESMIIAVTGGVIGTLIAWWAGHALSGVGTNVFPMPIEFDFSIDWLVLVFAIGVSMAAAILFGLAPALRTSKPELVPALKDSVEAGPRRRISIRDLLVVGQLAISLVLLMSGALLTRGLIAAQTTDLGYDPKPIASLSFNLQMNGYDTNRATALRDRAFQAVGALPGVTAVSTASRLPLAPDINMDGVQVPGHHGPNDEETPIDTVSIGATVAPTRIGAMMLGTFGAFALLLAAVGVYGVVAYSVSRRTREVGIRMALGAERGHVLRMVLVQGGRLAVVGIALGSLASVGLGRLLESLLYGVSGFDPLAYGIATGLLLLIAGAANLVPAITASRVDPVRALQSE